MLGDDLVGLRPLNGDDGQFHDPQVFDLTREPVNHLALGFGLHACLGAALARLEGHAVLRSPISTST